ncbi:MAG: IclR family transcriptional regulator domain-containing protein [Candidatus Malihini olakiniferum]
MSKGTAAFKSTLGSASGFHSIVLHLASVTCLVARTGISKEAQPRELASKTASTLTTPEAYRQHLVSVCQQGWAFDNEEDIVNIRCLAASITDSSGQVIAAISAVGTVLDIDPAKLQWIIDQLCRTVVLSPISPSNWGSKSDIKKRRLTDAVEINDKPISALTMRGRYGALMRPNLRASPSAIQVCSRQICRQPTPLDSITALRLITDFISSLRLISATRWLLPPRYQP